MKEKEKIEVVNPQTGKKYLVTLGETEGQAYKINLENIKPLLDKQWPFLGPVRHISEHGYKKKED